MFSYILKKKKTFIYMCVGFGYKSDFDLERIGKFQMSLLFCRHRIVQYFNSLQTDITYTTRRRKRSLNPSSIYFFFFFWNFKVTSWMEKTPEENAKWARQWNDKNQRISNDFFNTVKKFQISKTEYSRNSRFDL